MSTRFLIGVNTSEEIISNPPPQFQHLNLIYAPFAIRVGQRDYPASFWCDFAGVWLFKWCRAVWKLSRRKARSARLPFWYTYEVWLRQTPKYWWKVSLVKRETDAKTIIEEALVIPERVEAALLTASQKLIAGAKRVGLWTEDCAALEAFLDDPDNYLDGLESGSVSPPSFLSGVLGVSRIPNQPRMDLGWMPGGRSNGQQHSLPSEVVLPKPPAQRRFAPMPLFCPRCNAVLQPWGKQTQQACPLCRFEIRIG